METEFLLFGAILSVFLAFALLVWGVVPDEIEEDEIFGYRLTKRQRLIEEDLLYALTLPLVKLFSHYIRRLPDLPFFKMSKARNQLQEKLTRSGFMGAYTPNEFLGMCCTVGLISSSGVVVGTLLIHGEPHFGWAFVALMSTPVFPFIQLNSTIGERLIEIDRRLPYTIDLLVLSMRAGLDFMSALDRVVARGKEQNPDDPVIQEFSVVLQEMKVGTAKSDALLNLCERVDSEYLETMVGAVIQAEERGTPLARVLEVQVDTIRDKRTQRVEKAASEAAVKILLPLMFIFGSVVVIIMGAMVLRILREGSM